MFTSKLKKALILIVILILLTVGGWFVYKHTVNTKAEELVRDYLVSYNLEDRVTWDKLEASATGRVKLKDVTVLDEANELAATIDEIDIKYKENEQLIEGVINYERFRLIQEDEFSEQLDELYEFVSKDNPKYFDLFTEFKLDFVNDESFVKMIVDMPEILIVDLAMLTDNPQKLLELSKIDGTKIDYNNPMDADLRTIFQFFAEVKLSEIRLGLIDQGLMNSISQELLELDFESMPPAEREELMQDCIADLTTAQFPTDPKVACERVMSFAKGEEALYIKANFKQPIPIDVLIVSLAMELNLGVLADAYGLSIEVN